MILNWIKCTGDVWCKLNSINLDHEHFNGKNGIYIIWHGGSESKVVYVGKGISGTALIITRATRRYRSMHPWISM